MKIFIIISSLFKDPHIKYAVKQKRYNFIIAVIYSVLTNISITLYYKIITKLYSYYPKNKILLFIKNLNINYNEPFDIDYYRDYIKNHSNICKIRLANKTVLIDELLFSKCIESDDIEDHYRLHRFDWLFELLSESSNMDQLQLYKAVIILWHGSFVMNKKEIDMSPYSISSRLVNWILYLKIIEKYNILTPKEENIIINSIKQQILVLFNSIEYYGSHTNNHYFNNCRAFAVVGCYLNDNDMIRYCLDLLNIEYNRQMPFDQLEEGSSHYQLLISKWFIEILLFAYEYGKVELTQWLNVKTGKMLEISSDYYPQNSVSLVNIGDISPDHSPKYFAGYPFNQYSEIKSPIFLAYEKIFLKSTIGYLSEVLKTRYEYQNRLIKKILLNEYEFWIILCPLNKLRHGHNDVGSLIIIKNGKIIITDPGLANYKRGIISEKQKGYESHNTPVLHEISLFPVNISFHKFGDLKIFCTQKDINFTKLNGSEIEYIINYPLMNMEVLRTINIKSKRLIITDKVKMPIDTYECNWIIDSEAINNITNIFINKDLIFSKYNNEIRLERFPKSTQYGLTTDAYRITVKSNLKTNVYNISIEFI